MDFKALDSKKKVLVVLGVICFIAALIFMVRGVTPAGIAFFTLAALLPVLAVGGSEKIQAEVKPDANGDAMIGALQNRIDALRADNLRLKTRLEEVSGEYEDLKLQREAEKEAPPENTKNADKKAASSILPKGEGEDARIKTLDITEVIKEAAADFKAAADDAGVDILVIEPAEQMFVNAAPVMLRTLFRDIIDNAVKYMRRSGSLQVTIANLDDDIFVAMKDNGEGLSESETVHIFELNFQGSNRISGNGLGLAQAKAIVDYYGGMIYAKSSPGRGMGIYLHLPAERKL